MSITLSPEDQKKAEDLVASGRFSNINDALHAGLDALDEDPDWQEYARDRIAAGLEDIKAGRTVPAEEVLAKLRSYNQKKA
jgi:putative addiction module CopG family antidote